MLHALGAPLLPPSPRVRGEPRRGGQDQQDPAGRAQTAAEDALAEAGEAGAALLLLLARDAPASELARLFDLAAPTDGRLDPALASALQVRARLDGQRRREEQLAALYASASDLSSLHELEQVLQAIVRRARSLLGTDAAYLTLSDEGRAVTYMRVTDGIRTEAFKQVLLPFGAGLGGLVAATCTPYATADYAHDSRLVHRIDDTVTGEGLVAILGVPLRLGDKVIGVLYAANRRERPFDADEVALLLSLADHAAIAIENASLFEELGAALADLQRASGQLQVHSDLVERTVAEHERLSAVLLSGGGLTEVAAATLDVVGGSLLVADADGTLLAEAGPEVPDARDIVAGAVPAVRSRRPVTSGSRSGRAATVVPVFAGTETLGALVSVGADLEEPGVRTLERAAVVTALLLLQERSIALAEHRVRGELFDDLLALPQRDSEGLHRRASHVGLDLSGSYVVVVARMRDETPTAAAWRAVRSACGPGGTAAQHRGDLVLLVALEAAPESGSATATASQVAVRVSEQLQGVADGPVTVGAAGPGTGARELAELYREACRCCDVLVSLGRAGQAASREELGVYGLLLSASGQGEVDRFVSRTVGPLLDYDRDRGSELVRTLLAYYGSGGSLTRTAQELFVHVNTLYQRLERVTQLLGNGWRSGDGALQVHLALQLNGARA
jgi:GAF domain-containing protein